MPTQCSRDLFGFAPGRATGSKRRSRPCWRSGSSASRSATKTSSTTISCATPLLATLAGKVQSKRTACAPLAGKSTLHRLEHAPLGPSRSTRADRSSPQRGSSARPRRASMRATWPSPQPPPVYQRSWWFSRWVGARLRSSRRAAPVRAEGAGPLGRRQGFGEGTTPALGKGILRLHPSASDWALRPRDNRLRRLTAHEVDDRAQLSPPEVPEQRQDGQVEKSGRRAAARRWRRKRPCRAGSWGAASRSAATRTAAVT
jgi:hypothetical protein